MKEAAIKQFPKTSAKADVKGVAKLSGFMRLLQAHNTLTYARYRSNATCIKTANMYVIKNCTVKKNLFFQKSIIIK
jgi:hypothetical protein